MTSLVLNVSVILLTGRHDAKNEHQLLCITQFTSRFLNKISLARCVSKREVRKCLLKYKGETLMQFLDYEKCDALFK